MNYGETVGRSVMLAEVSREVTRLKLVEYSMVRLKDSWYMKFYVSYISVRYGSMVCC